MKLSFHYLIRIDIGKFFQFHGARVFGVEGDVLYFIYAEFLIAQQWPHTTKHTDIALKTKVKMSVNSPYFASISNYCKHERITLPAERPQRFLSKNVPLSCS